MTTRRQPDTRRPRRSERSWTDGRRPVWCKGSSWYDGHYLGGYRIKFDGADDQARRMR
jgi:hypothetical protein